MDTDRISSPDIENEIKTIVRRVIVCMSLIGLLLFCSLLVSSDDSSAAVVDSGTCGTGVTWELSDTGVLSISGSGAMTNWSSASNVPWRGHLSDIKTINVANEVTRVGNYAFYNCSNVKSVSLGTGITAIGNNSFEKCSAVKSVTLPSNLTSIGKYAFFDCKALTSISIPSGVTVIEEYTFRFCNNLSIVAFQGNVTSIKNDAFGECKIGILMLPDSLTSLGAYSFGGCTSLTSLYIPISVNAVASNSYPAFKDCSSLIEVHFLEGNGNGFDYSTNTTSDSYYGKTPWNNGHCEDIVIGSGVKKIGNYTFKGCSSIKSVRIMNSVTSLGTECFSGCTGMERLSIPISINAVVSNKNPVFGDCTGLKEVTFTAGSTGIGFDYTYYDGGALLGNNTWYQRTPWYMSRDNLETIKILSGVKSIGKYAFADQTHCHDFNIPSSCTTVESGAFRGCLGIEELTIGDKIKSVDTSAFSYCTSLKTLVITDDVESIGYYAFYGCTGLTSLTIPISFDASTVSEKEIFTETSNIKDLTLTKGTGVGVDYSLYTHTPWYLSRESLESITIEDGVTYIGDNMFRRQNVTEMTIPDSVTRIGDYAFYSCVNLETLNIPDSIDSIDSYAFQYCSSITEFTVPSGLTTIRSGMLYGCTSLSSVVIPGSVTTIDDNAFNGCTSLTEIHLPDSLKRIYSNAFNGCSSITSIIIPDSVTLIQTAAFANCSKLAELTIPISVNCSQITDSNVYGNAVFKNCPLLCKFNLTKGQNDAFDYINGAYKGTPWYLNRDKEIVVSLADDIKSIGNRTFSDCTGLSKIVIPDSVTVLGAGCFSGCVGLRELTLPISLDPIGKLSDLPAFKDCVNIDVIKFTKGTGTGVDYSTSSAGLYIVNTPWNISKEKFTEVTIPDGVEYIGNYMFFDMRDLSSVVFEGSIPRFGTGTFYCCESLTSIPLSDGITEIPSGAFYGCSSMTGVTIPDSVTEIGEDAFYCCSSITEITFPDGLKTIGDRAFLGCVGLSDIVLPDSVNTIGTAFKDTSLNSFKTGTGLDSGFTVGFKNGSVSITNDQAALLKGRQQLFSIDINTDVPETVKDAAGVFDVVRVNIGDSPFTDSGASVTVYVKTLSRIREMFVISDDGTATKIDSSVTYEGGTAVYSFRLTASSYVSAIAESEGIPYEKEILIVMVSAGTLVGLFYLYRGRKP